MPPYDDILFVPPAPVARVVVRYPEREESIGGVPELPGRSSLAMQRQAALAPRADYCRRLRACSTQVSG